MKRLVAVDTMPEFETLTIESSNLMIEAKSLRAQGETFESAIKWVEAGRKLAELGTRLLYAGHTYEAAQDILHSAASFLQAGATPNALDQLRFLEVAKELEEDVSENESLHDESATLTQDAKHLDREFREAWRQMQELMVDPRGAARLTRRWITSTLPRFPGVWQFHFYTARKYMHEAQGSGGAAAQKFAIGHLSYAVRIHKEDPFLAILLVGQLIASRQWVKAIEVADGAVNAFPENAEVLSHAGWARLVYVFKGHGPKAALEDAERLLRKALDTVQGRPVGRIATDYLSLFLCLRERQKSERELKKLLDEAMAANPAAAREAWALMRSPTSSIEALGHDGFQDLQRNNWNVAEALFFPTAA